ncbi:MAG: hypothetical protein CMG74_11260 [Candidatus Marinimicrobia bacterium]|nr:hypothetical protein [Candidatus Neomarinimicrobiota bacterium]
MNDEKQKEKLFNEGLKYYKDMNFFEAHESWETLWSDFYLDDRKFMQGLIQLSVSFYHFGNGNIKGAISQIKKSNEKFEQFSGIHRGINVTLLLSQISNVLESYNQCNNLSNFDWSIIPTLE